MHNVYLDYAATTPLDRDVLEEMMPYLTEYYGNPDSLHAYGRKAAYAVTCARDRVAAVLGVLPQEVYFTSGGTEADNWAVRNLKHTGAVYASAIEHHAVLGALSFVNGKQLPVGKDGRVKVELPQDAGLLAVQAVNNETGCIQPIGELSALCRQHGVLLFSDCVQAGCTQDLKKLASLVDAMSLSGHKLYGPKGVGVLVVKSNCAITPLIKGGEQERSLRGGTSNVAAVVGFAAALERVQSDREEFCRHTSCLRELFEQKVLDALGDKVRIDGEGRVPNISHLTVHGGESLLARLDLHGIYVSGGAACAAHSQLPSHVMLAMGSSEEQARSGIRVSFGKHTTQEETLFAAQTLIGLVSREE